MSNKTEIIISTYKQANKDAGELLKYIDSISSPEDLIEPNLPDLVTKLQDKESSITRTYIEGASILGGSVAVAVGTSITSGILAKSVLSTGTAIALRGIGLAVPGLNLITIPAIALPFLIELLKDSKIKKYIKENKTDLKNKKDAMQKSKEKLTDWLNNLLKQTAEIDNKLREEIKVKFSEYKEKTKKIAKDVSIQIDDCLNANTNKRILQYNEIILNQYKLQKDLEEKVDFLFTEYNNLLSQKQELERQVNCLFKLLTAMGCPESVINQALNESEA